MESAPVSDNHMITLLFLSLLIVLHFSAQQLQPELSWCHNNNNNNKNLMKGNKVLG